MNGSLHMNTLRSKVIKLAYSNLDLRPHLLPLLKKATEFDTQSAMDKYMKDHPGEDKTNHSVKKDSKSGVNTPDHIRGKARVTNNAKVYGKAQIFGNAWAGGKASISGNAKVSGKAMVYGTAKVSGNAIISGGAMVCGEARVSGTARINGSAIIIGGIWDGSEGEVAEGKWKAPGVTADYD